MGISPVGSVSVRWDVLGPGGCQGGSISPPVTGDGTTEPGWVTLRSERSGHGPGAREDHELHYNQMVFQVHVTFQGE